MTKTSMGVEEEADGDGVWFMIRKPVSMHHGRQSSQT